MPAKAKSVRPSKRPVPSLRLQVSIVVEEDGDSYHAYCPAFKGLHVDGKNVDEAVERAREAVRIYLKSLLLHGEPLPVGPDCAVLREEHAPLVPPGALLRNFELSWPSLNMSGAS